MVSSLILVLGLMFLAFLKRESVIFNKKVLKIHRISQFYPFFLKIDSVQVIKKNFFCREKLKNRKISTLVSVEIVKRGANDLANRTIHYKLVLYFTDEKPLEILESSNKFEIKKNVKKQ